MKRNVTSMIGDYIEGGYTGHESFIPTDVYGKVLDSIVVACVDILVIGSDGNVILGKRARHPYPDWWLFGGRMRTGEALERSAQRLIQDELGIFVESERFMYLTTFSTAWKQRAHPPVDNGTHTLSVVYCLKLEQNEEDVLAANDEYERIDSFQYKDIIANNNNIYHPALVQTVISYDAYQ